MKKYYSVLSLSLFFSLNVFAQSEIDAEQNPEVIRAQATTIRRSINANLRSDMVYRISLLPIETQIEYLTELLNIGKGEVSLNYVNVFEPGFIQSVSELVSRLVGQGETRRTTDLLQRCELRLLARLNTPIQTTILLKKLRIMAQSGQNADSETLEAVKASILQSDLPAKAQISVVLEDAEKINNSRPKTIPIPRKVWVDAPVAEWTDQQRTEFAMGGGHPQKEITVVDNVEPPKRSSYLEIVQWAHSMSSQKGSSLVEVMPNLPTLGVPLAVKTIAKGLANTSGRAVAMDASSFVVGAFAERCLAYFLTQDPMRLRKLTLPEIQNEIQNVLAPMTVGGSIGSIASQSLRLKSGSLVNRSFVIYAGILALQIYQGKFNLKQQPLELVKVLASAAMATRVMQFLKISRIGVQATEGVVDASGVAVPESKWATLLIHAFISQVILNGLTEIKVSYQQSILRNDVEKRFASAIDSMDQLLKKTRVTLGEIFEAHQSVTENMLVYEMVLNQETPLGKSTAMYLSETQEIQEKMDREMTRQPEKEQEIRLKYAVPLARLADAYGERVEQLKGRRTEPHEHFFELPLPGSSIDVTSVHGTRLSVMESLGRIIPRVQLGDVKNLTERYIASRLDAIGNQIPTLPLMPAH